MNSNLVSFRSGFRNDFSTLCRCFQMVITSSFQLQFAHCLKHWTPDFSRFKMIYSMWIMDFRKFSKLALKLLPFEFRIACEVKRSFKSCRIESKNEWKKFHTLCEILHTMRNLLRQQRISHTMPNLAWYTKSSCALTPLDFYLHIFCVIS